MRGILASAVAAAMLVAGCGASTPTAREPGDLAVGWSTDFTRAVVPLDEITSGGPPKDGIPSIDRPAVTPVAEVTGLADREPVHVLEIDGRVRAYPLRILIWHEIVNDLLGGHAVAVTYCPLCNTATVFDREVGGRRLDFGTTGKLRNSDLVMYDRQTETWWQQFDGRAIVGELVGIRLAALPSRTMSFGEFRQRFPTGSVLRAPDGSDRPYGRNPYTGYDAPGSPTYFPTANDDDRRLDPKERVVFVERDGDAAAVPFSVLQTRRMVRVTVGATTMTVSWRSGAASALDAERIADGRNVGSATVVDDAGRPVPFVESLWFAVAAFSPGVRVVTR